MLKQGRIRQKHKEIKEHGDDRDETSNSVPSFFFFGLYR